MAVELRAQPVPLRLDQDGVIRVGGTRVTLHTIVNAFHQGLGAEEIADRYPSLTLADVYSVIGYYLQHRATLDGYLDQQRSEADQVRIENQRRWPPTELRAKLLARRQSPEP
jgi:uncharacterized protein (DUF433 family)